MKRWQFWLGVAVSVIFMFFALRSIHWAAAWDSFKTAQWHYLLVAWLCLLVSYLVRALRWRTALLPLKKMPLWTVWRVFMVGSMSNNILPARAGELVRSYLLGQLAQVNAASVLGTVALERVSDVIAVLLLLILGVALGVLRGQEDTYGLWLGGIGVGGLVVGVGVVAVWGSQLVDWGERLMGRVSPRLALSLGRIGRAFVCGLRSVDSMGRALSVFSLTAVSWALFVCYAYSILHAFAIQVDLAQTAFLLGFAGLAVSIPSAPGSIGTLEYTFILGLSLLQVGDEGSRGSAALTYHILEWVTTLALGLFCLGQLGLSFTQVSAMVVADAEG